MASPAPAAAADSRHEPAWYQRQLRIVQTVLREPDIVGYDADAVAAYLGDVRANCLVINSGGIVDFFRHDLPTANPNPFMAPDQDLLRDIVAACRRRGIRVIARVDFRGVDRRIYEARPDWFGLDEAGQPLLRREQPLAAPLYAPCYLSEYRNAHAYRFIDLLLDRYDLDGIWENAPQVGGVCYCRRCAARYRAELGEDLPRGGDFLDPRYDPYRRWKERCVLEHFRDSRAAVKRRGADKVYVAEVFGLFSDHYKSRSLDLYSTIEHFDFLVTPLFTADYEPLSAPATLVKFLRSLAPEKTPVALFGHLGSDNRLRNVASPVAETRLWMWQGISAGGSLWDTTFTGQHPGVAPDRRNAELPREAYAYMERFATSLNAQQAVADVELLYSRDTRLAFGDHARGKDRSFPHLLGLEQVLLDEHIQYTIRPEMALTDAGLSGTRVLALPNVACLSDDQAAAIRRFVERGGRLLATHATSLYDEHGRERPDFALGDLFGCAYTGIAKDATAFGYHHVRGPHALTAGLERTALIANGGENLLVRLLPGAGAEAPLGYVPPIPPQPPERAWLPGLETDYPTAILRRHGRGLVVYLPWEVDRQVWAHGHADFSLVLANALRALLGGERSLETDAPPSVQLCLNAVRGTRRYLVHAINLTAAPRRPVQRIVPVSDLTVSVTLAGGAVEAFRVLHGAGASRVLAQEALPGGRVRVRIGVPRIEEYVGLCVETRPA